MSTAARLKSLYARNPGERAAALARVAQAAVDGRVSPAVHEAMGVLARALFSDFDQATATEIIAAEEAVLEAWEAQLS